MRLRALLARTVARLAAVAAALASGDLSFGAGDSPEYRLNARLILRSWRDLRGRPAGRLAELLDTSALSLYLFGAPVCVDVASGALVLLDPRGGGIDTLTWVDERRHLARSRRWGDEGPTLGLYFGRPRRR